MYRGRILTIPLRHCPERELRFGAPVGPRPDERVRRGIQILSRDRARRIARRHIGIDERAVDATLLGEIEQRVQFAGLFGFVADDARPKAAPS